MADKVRIWFDAEADFLEVRFSDAAGYEKETKHDALMERVDAQGARHRLQRHGRKPLQEIQSAGGGFGCRLKRSQTHSR